MMKQRRIIYQGLVFGFLGGVLRTFLNLWFTPLESVSFLSRISGTFEQFLPAAVGLLAALISSFILRSSTCLPALVGRDG